MTKPEPIKGHKMTPEQRQDCLLKLSATIGELLNSVTNDLTAHLLAKSTKLADDELLELTRGNVQHYRAARCLLVALAAARIAGQWQCESTIRDTRRVARWLRNRY